MAVDRGIGFLGRLRADLQSHGVREQELAEWLSLSPSTVSRRLNGKSEFSRDELVAIDERLGHGGGLLVSAGYLPDTDELPRSRYFDEATFQERFDEILLLTASPHTSVGVTERRIKRLLSYLGSVEQCRSARLFQLHLQLELLDCAANRSGVTLPLLRSALGMRCAIDEVRDRALSYVYESFLSDFYVGFDDHERALRHQLRSLDLIPPGAEWNAERLHTEITVARLMAPLELGGQQAERALASATEALWVDGYRPWQWPSPLDGPSYLDVLHAKFAMQIARGEMAGAGDTVSLILDKFLTSPRVSDNITSLLCAAEFFARDDQPTTMERHLADS